MRQNKLWTFIYQEMILNEVESFCSSFTSCWKLFHAIILKECNTEAIATFIKYIFVSSWIIINQSFIYAC